MRNATSYVLWRGSTAAAVALRPLLLLLLLLHASAVAVRLLLLLGLELLRWHCSELSLFVEVWC